MQFLLLLGGIAVVLIIFAIGPLMAVLHIFLRSDWQPIGGRNFVWALLVLVPLVWMLYFVLYFLLWRRPSFPDDE